MIEFVLLSYLSSMAMLLLILNFKLYRHFKLYGHHYINCVAYICLSNYLMYVVELCLFPYRMLKVI